MKKYKNGFKPSNKHIRKAVEELENIVGLKAKRITFKEFLRSDK